MMTVQPYIVKCQALTSDTLFSKLAVYALKVSTNFANISFSLRYAIYYCATPNEGQGIFASK
jgi:hypothetical protein